MKRSLLTKLAASAASITMIAGAMTAPADSILSKMTLTSSITASAWDDIRLKDSTGTFYVKLDNADVKNDKCQAQKAMIVGVVSSKIKPGSTLTIPKNITVSGQDYGKNSFTTTVKVTDIGVSAFANEASLTSISIPDGVTKIANDAFKNSGLKSLTLPSSITGVGSGAFDNCDGLKNVNYSCAAPTITAFTNCDNLKSFNGKPILSNNDKTKEPILHADVFKEVSAQERTYDTYKDCPWISQYVTAYVDFIVKTKTNSSDSDIEKAKKLHDWLLDNTVYDQAAYDSGATPTVTMEAWSPFLHKKSNGKYYAVCAGYARAYKMLLNAAGVECYTVDGMPLDGSKGGHAWNVVKIAGNYYHVDTTWDDSNSDHYKYFMRSDAVINTNHKFNWSGTINGVKKDYKTGAAKYDLYNLGDVNWDAQVTNADATAIQRYLLKLKTFSDSDKVYADVNLDGKIDMSDATCIQSALTKMKNKNYTKSLFEFIYAYGGLNV